MNEKLSDLFTQMEKTFFLTNDLLQIVFSILFIFRFVRFFQFFLLFLLVLALANHNIYSRCTKF